MVGPSLHIRKELENPPPPWDDQVLRGGGRFYLSTLIEVSSWADSEGEIGKSQVIWVSIGNKQLDTTTPLWKKLDPPPKNKLLDLLWNLGKGQFSLKVTFGLL